MSSSMRASNTDREDVMTSLEITVGDITRQADMDAIVNAANRDLKPGGGVAGAIHRAAGPELARACAPLAPIRPGEAVITEGFDLPNRYVIHCLGPVYQLDQPSARLLADCYRNALELAASRELASVAFPAISTGVFGYPMGEAARVALRTVRAVTGQRSSLQQVRFVLFDPSAGEVHRRVLDELEAG